MSREDKELVNILNEYVKEEMSKLKREAYKVINNITNELYKESIKMYDSFIDQFYKYKTQSYKRHDDGIGTMTGVSLYRASNIKFHENRKGLSFFELDIDVPDSYYTDYPDFDYKGDSPTQVYEYIIQGHRFNPRFDNYFKGKHMETIFKGSYNGIYFKSGNNVTIKEAFDKFVKDYDSISGKLFENRFIPIIEKMNIY